MPTVTIGEKTGATFTGCQDTHVKASAPTTNSVSTDTLEVYKYATGDHNHGLIKFPGLSNIPAIATITAVTLFLAAGESNVVAAQTITARRLLRDWVQNQATWNIFSTGNNWGTAGGLSDGVDRASTVSATGTVTSAVDTYSAFTSAQLLADVQAIVAGTLPNYGWHLERTDGLNDSTFLFFHSSESGTATLRPYLEVVYTAPIDVLSTVGTGQTWNWPAGVTSVLAECVGGGGAGGSATGSPATGGGGKGGSYAAGTITKGGESSLTVDVGAGGTSATVHGLYSRVVQGGSTAVGASGGSSGANATVNSTAGAGATTVNGGASVGTTLWAGGNGGTGVFTSGVQGSGAGGGAAGPTSAGGAASVNVAGTAGTGAFGDTRLYAGAGAAGVGNNLPGLVGPSTGPVYGGGGSGGKAITTADRLGGAGRQGVVVLTWTEGGGGGTIEPAAGSSSGTSTASAAGSVVPAATTPPFVTGLVAYWPLNESPEVNAFDAHGTTPLTVHNLIGSQTGVQGGARTFVAASSQYFSSTDALLQTGDIDCSFSIWVYPTAFVDSFIFTKDNVDTSRDYGLQITPGRDVVWYINAKTYSLTWPTALFGYTWAHIACGHDATNNLLWLSVNGAPRMTVSTGGTAPIVSGTEFRVGALAYATPYYFSGALDEFAFWKRALTPGEVTWLYNAGAGRSYADLVAAGVGVGTAAGTSTAAGVAVAATRPASVGTAAGTSTASAASVALAVSVGATAGTSTVTGVSVTVVRQSAVGTTAGTSTVNGVSVAGLIAASVATSAGVSTVNGVSVAGATVAAVATSAGTSTATGVWVPPPVHIPAGIRDLVTAGVVGQRSGPATTLAGTRTLTSVPAGLRELSVQGVVAQRAAEPSSPTWRRA